MMSTHRDLRSGGEICCLRLSCFCFISFPSTPLLAVSVVSLVGSAGKRVPRTAEVHGRRRRHRRPAGLPSSTRGARAANPVAPRRRSGASGRPNVRVGHGNAEDPPRRNRRLRRVRVRRFQHRRREGKLAGTAYSPRSVD